MVSFSLLISGCDDSSDPAPMRDPAEKANLVGLRCPGGGEPDPRDNIVCGAPATPAEAGLEQCPSGPRGGGYGVRIKGVQCGEIRRTLPLFGSAGYAGKHRFFRNEYGWVCWSRLERRFGPIHNICFRDRQVVFFYQG